jgi:hypothetical protein
MVQNNTTDIINQADTSNTKGVLHEVPPEIEDTAPDEKPSRKGKKKTPKDFTEEFEGIIHGGAEKAKIKAFLMDQREFPEVGIDSLMEACELRCIKKNWEDKDGNKHLLDTLVVPYRAAVKGDGIPYMQDIAMEGENLKYGGKFNRKGSTCKTDGFFVVGGSADTVMIHESAIDALAGKILFPTAQHIALGSSIYVDKVSALKGLNKKILVAQKNEPAGKTMLADIFNILGSGIMGIKWSDTAKAKSKMAMNGILQTGEKPEIDKLFAPVCSLLRKNNKIFKLTRLSEMKLKPADWLIKGFMEVDSMDEIFGPSGGGKTFCAVDLGCSCATGTDFNGLPVKQGPVIYVAGEGQNGIKRRFMAWGKHKGVDMDTADIFISNIPAGLTDPQQVKFVIDAIHAIADEVAPPVAIIFDTIARNFGPGDENSTRDMTQFVKAGDEIRSLYRSAVIYVHHTGLAEQGRARGSSVLKGALDSEYRVEMENNGIIILKNTKMKDHDKPKPMAFKLESVDLGFSADGDPITSAVLISENYVPPSKGTTARQGKWQTVTKVILRDLVKEHINNTKPQNITNGCVVKIPIADVKDNAIKKGLDPRTWYRYPPYLESLDGVTLNEQYFEVDATSATNATLLHNV